MSSDVIVWFRRDLRLDDNPAVLSPIADANKFDKGVIAVYLQYSELADPLTPGPASTV